MSANRWLLLSALLLLPHALLTGCEEQQEAPPSPIREAWWDAGEEAGIADAHSPELNSAVDSGAPQQSEVTWHAQIAPLLARKCGPCHQEGSVGPFAVTSYERAKPFAKAMAEAVESGRMPPFPARQTSACDAKLPWADDPTLSASEQAQLRAWADDGAPEGVPSGSPPPEPPAVNELARVDLSLRIPEPIHVSGSQDVHTCIILDPKLERDRYVIGTLVTPGNKRILHHSVSYMLLPGVTPGFFGIGSTPRSKAELIAKVEAERGVKLGQRYECRSGLGLTELPIETLDVWAPGGGARYLPEDTGMYVPQDALILIYLHYHPNGASEVDDSTSLSLQFTDDKPAKVAQMVLVGNFWRDSPFEADRLITQPGELFTEFRIPKNATNHVEEMSRLWQLRQPVRIYGLFAHMHVVGSQMRIWVERRSQHECLLETPHWDYNWQLVYNYQGPYDQLPELRSGDVMRLRCSYDNTLNNRLLKEDLAKRRLTEPEDVVLGEDTNNEMCASFVGITYPNPL